MPEDEEYRRSLMSTHLASHVSTRVAYPAPPMSHLFDVAAWVPLTLELGDRAITLNIAPNDKPLVRQHLKDLVRKEKRRAAQAGNAANTAQQIGVGIGSALAVAGGVAMLTVAAPLVLGAAVATGVGAILAIGGLGTGHWMNGKKFEHEEKIDRFNDALEDLK